MPIQVHPGQESFDELLQMQEPHRVTPHFLNSIPQNGVEEYFFLGPGGTICHFACLY